MATKYQVEEVTYTEEELQELMSGEHTTLRFKIDPGAEYIEINIKQGDIDEER